MSYQDRLSDTSIHKFDVYTVINDFEQSMIELDSQYKKRQISQKEFLQQLKPQVKLMQSEMQQKVHLCIQSKFNQSVVTPPYKPRTVLNGFYRKNSQIANTPPTCFKRPQSKHHLVSEKSYSKSRQIPRTSEILNEPADDTSLTSVIRKKGKSVVLGPNPVQSALKDSFSEKEKKITKPKKLQFNFDSPRSKICEVYSNFISQEVEIKFVRGEPLTNTAGWKCLKDQMRVWWDMVLVVLDILKKYFNKRQITEQVVPVNAIKELVELDPEEITENDILTKLGTRPPQLFPTIPFFTAEALGETKAALLIQSRWRGVLQRIKYREILKDLFPDRFISKVDQPNDEEKSIN